MDQIGYLGRSQSHGLQFPVMAKYLLWSPVKHLLPMVHHNQTVRIPGHILHAVGNQYDGHMALPVEPVNLVQNFVPSPWIQAGCRLVQYKDLRFHGQHASYGHPPFLAAGKLKRRLFIIGRVQAHLLQGFFCPGFGLLPAQSLILRSEAYICQHIHFKKLVLRILEYQTHLTPQLLHVIALAVDILPVVVEFACAGFYQPV